MARLTLLILAGGIGSRYGDFKQICSFGPNGEAIMDYSIRRAVTVGFNKVVIVTNQEIFSLVNDTYQKRYGSMIQLTVILQHNSPGRIKPLGTAHAVMCAAEVINEPFLVVNADDFYGDEAFSLMANHLSQNLDFNDAFLVSYSLNKVLSEAGKVSRGILKMDHDDVLVAVEEHISVHQADELISGINPRGTTVILPPDSQVSMNFWGFQPSVMPHLKRLFNLFIEEQENEQSEFGIPGAVSQLMNNGLISVKVIAGGDDWCGVTYRQDAEVVRRLLNSRIQ